MMKTRLETCLMVYTVIVTLLITNCEVQIWIVQMMVQQISEMKGSQ